jgi:hypothetical protein
VKNKERPRVLPFSSVKTWPNFQRMCASTVEDFFCFVRSWKIVAFAEFLGLKMVI